MDGQFTEGFLLILSYLIQTKTGAYPSNSRATCCMDGQCIEGLNLICILFKPLDLSSSTLNFLLCCFFNLYIQDFNLPEQSFFFHKDIDECAFKKPCQHECRNTIGSYQCTCPPGYQLLSNGRTCKGESFAFFIKKRFFINSDTHSCI